MTTSPDLGVPYLAQQQAQPETTHNAALDLLQMAMKGVTGTAANSPPGSPTEGDVAIVGSAPTGAWAGRANCLAGYFGGAWRFFPDRDDDGTPIVLGARHEGIRVWASDLDCGLVWTGSAWVAEGGAMRSYTVATLPAATGPKRWIYVSDEAGGAVPCFNDGVDWRRCTDRAAAS